MYTKKNQKIKVKILHIGPLTTNEKTTGGMVAYMESFLNSGITTRFQFGFVNTLIPDFYRRFRSLRIFLTIKFIYQMLWQIIVYKPLILHVHMSSGKGRLGFWEKWFLGYLGKKFRKKVIFHLHGSDFDQFFLDKENEYFISRALKTADKNIVLSRSWYSALLKFIPEEKLIYIPNAIHTSLFDRRKKSTRQTDRINILFVGSVGKRKGLFDLGESIRILRDQKLPDFQIHVVGEEEHRGELEAIKRFYRVIDVEKYFVFHGGMYGKSKIDIFQKSDIFVLPSHNESFGIVNLEAMASGLPVISTRVGAIPEYLVHGENGFLIDPGNIEQLGDFLKKLIMDRGLRLKMGLVNKEKVRKHFDWSIISLEICKLYDAILVN